MLAIRQLSFRIFTMGDVIPFPGANQESDVECLKKLVLGLESINPKEVLKSSDRLHKYETGETRADFSEFKCGTEGCGTSCVGQDADGVLVISLADFLHITNNCISKT